jgi:flagellar secretion chaperone FliS
MANASYDDYLKNEIFSADPIKLVTILYRAGIGAIGAAREHLAAGAIRDRSRQITKAWTIIHELGRSLDRERGGEIGGTLAALYAYMQTRLIEANARQIDEPLAEVQKLLSTLLDGWCAIRNTPPAPANLPAGSDHHTSGIRSAC